MENITTNDHTFKENLTMSRLYIGMSYLNSNFFELLIQQLTHLCIQKIDPMDHLFRPLEYRFVQVPSDMHVERLLNSLKT
jgi:hypothetical protein